MKKVDLQAELRTDKPNRIRLSGSVPGVVYGKGIDAVSIQLNSKKLSSIFNIGSNKNVIINLDVKGSESIPVLAHEIQVDPITDKIMHIDFVKIDMQNEIKTKVPLVFVGEAEGVKLDGGILVQAMRNIEIKCLPGDIPDKIEVNVSPLKIGDSIHVGNLVPPKGVTIISSKDDAVVTVSMPTKEEEVTPAAEQAVAVEAAPAADGAAPAADAKAAAPEADKSKAPKASK